MKAQVSAEFLIFIGVAMLVLIIALGFISEDMTRLTRQKEENAIADLGYYLQNEMMLAAMVNDGYHRQFTIPTLKDGVSYNITTEQGIFILLTSEHGMTRGYWVPYFNGSFNIGTNTIEKQGGIIYLNR